MELSEQQLVEVEKWAELLFSPQEIAAILEVDAKLFCKQIKIKTGPVYRSFIKGKLITEAALRQATLTFAKQGSVPALSASLKFREEQNTSMLK